MKRLPAKERGFVDFSALFWAGLLLGVLLGACGSCAGRYLVQHVEVSFE